MDLLRIAALVVPVTLLLLERQGWAVPPDPFAGEYAPPRPTEVGTAAEQLRFLGSAGGIIDGSVGVAGQGTIELMTLAWVGVRGSGLATMPLGSGPQLFAARLGPSLHLLPYQRVDLGAFFEGGVALVDVTKSSRGWMPVVVAGGTIDIALSSFFVIHLEGYIEAGVADRGGRADVLVHPVGLIGPGLTL